MKNDRNIAAENQTADWEPHRLDTSNPEEVRDFEEAWQAFEIDSGKEIPEDERITPNRYLD